MCVRMMVQFENNKKNVTRKQLVVEREEEVKREECGGKKWK